MGLSGKKETQEKILKYKLGKFLRGKKREKGGSLLGKKKRMEAGGD